MSYRQAANQTNAAYSLAERHTDKGDRQTIIDRQVGRLPIDRHCRQKNQAGRLACRLSAYKAGREAGMPI
jgi:hypothetical protein